MREPYRELFGSFSNLMRPAYPMSQPTDSTFTLSRRNFVALSGLLPAAAIVSQSLGTRAFAASPASSPIPSATRGTRNYPIALELYSVRTELMRDLHATLREVSKIGYEAVEFYAPYFGWTMPYAKEVRSLIDDLGMRCYSTHNHIISFTPGEGMSRAIELNQILGARHLVMSSAPRGTDGLENWKRLCGQLSTAVELLQPHGLTAGFHNHQTEWRKIDGDRRIMDVIAANTPQEFVLQFDIGTCMEAGADPISWIKANPGRIKSVHLKDWAPGSHEDGKGYKVLFGEGVTPWSEIIAALESVGGVEFYIMEQEGSRFSEFETAQRCLDTWHEMRKKA